MDWGNDMCLKLIEEYEKLPVLWDLKHEFYYSKNRKMEAWEALAQVIGVDQALVKQKMSSLLGSFRKERLKNKKSIGSGKDGRKFNSSRWFAYEKFWFLLDRDRGSFDTSYKKRRQREEADDEDVAVGEDMSIKVEIASDFEEGHHHPGDEAFAEVSEGYFDEINQENAPDSSMQISKRLKTTSCEKDPTGTANFHPEVLQALLGCRAISVSETEYDLWARSVAVQLNSMDTVRALKLQLKLQTAITEERIAHELRHQKKETETVSGGTGNGNVTEDGPEEKPDTARKIQYPKIYEVDK